MQHHATVTKGRSQTASTAFAPINRGYNATFVPNRLSLGLVVPIEAYPSSAVPTMGDHLARAQLAEQLGFAAVWLRDVPFNVPSFGDAGQTFDPFVYLGFLAAGTKNIALGVASTILPLRHPAHVAKAAASADALSDGRLLLGIASGDRPDEYPALGLSFNDRGERFRDSYEYIRNVRDRAPRFHSAYGTVGGGMDMLPKPAGTRLPLLITGGSQQAPDWIARNGDGWMTYPRPADLQRGLIGDYRARIAGDGLTDKPVMEPLYIDLARDPDAPPAPIDLGLRLGVNALREYLHARQEIGVNHVALNLRFNSSPVEQTLETLATDLLPHFHK